MTRKMPTENELLTIADEVNEIKRIAWCLASAADGVPSQEPAVQGIAHVCTILLERIEALDERLQQEPPRAA
jgi:cytochrome c1